MLLIGWSILEGIGGALMWVSMYSIIIGSYTDEKTTALGLGVSIASIGLVVGPFIGGYLTTYFSWRYAFGFSFHYNTFHINIFKINTPHCIQQPCIGERLI